MSRHSTPTPTARSSADGGPLRSRLRAAARLTGLGIWTGAGLAVWAAGRLLLLPLPRWYRGFRRRLLQAWSRGACGLLGIRVQVTGAVPAPPFFLVSNHLSYLDIVVFAAQTPCRFVAKREVSAWPGVGALARIMETIFIDRTVRRDALRVLARLDRAMQDGDGVVLFAEATSTAGRSVLPFRPALLEWAARSGRAVHYASVSYRTPAGAPPAHLAVCWWGDMTFGRHLMELARLPCVHASVQFGPAPIAERDRKRLAGRLHEAVRAQFVPVVTRE